MKKIHFTFLMLGLLITLSGCTYIGNMGDTGIKLDESIEYTEDLSKFDQLVLKIDLSVSGVKISETDGQSLDFEQKANREDLLAEMFVDRDGDTVEITFKNKESGLFNSGNQNSEAEISIPKHLLTDLELDINVGDVVMTGEDISFSKIVASLDVGELKFNLEANQPDLDEVLLTTNVGEINLTLSGAHEKLSKIEASSDVGSVETVLSGSYDHKLELEGSANVGSVAFDLSGTFEKDVNGSFETNTGDVTIVLPENSPVYLDIDINEHTSDLSIKSKDYKTSGKTYIFNEDANHGEIYINASTDIGDLQIK